jgi:hypothetical protein
MTELRSIRWPLGILLAGLAGVPAGSIAYQAAQPAEAAPAVLTKEQDHQRTMDLLHITELRRGRDGDNNSPFHANYDESKANPFPNLPDALTLKNGKKVTTAAVWWNQRRPEIVEDFDREIYGRVPKNVPKVTWSVKDSTSGKSGEVDTVIKQLVGHVDNSSYPAINVDIALTLTLPANAKGPVPVIMVFGAGGGGQGRGRGAPLTTAGFQPYIAPGTPSAPGAPAAVPAVPPAGRGPQGPSAQQQILARGWGYASLSTGSIQQDSGNGLQAGIIGLVNKGQPRSLEDWGVLRAWAWGASRALDYFETDQAVDAKHVAVEGHSRWGKATIVAVAYDQRFWTGYVSSSGEGGTKLHRRDWGEIVENVAATGEYNWMAGNFLKYAGPLQWGEMPVDAHELIAMCAPRPIFISGGDKGDFWQDAKGMFMAAAAAGPVYKLLGKKDLGVTEMPPMETALVAGDVAFRQHSQGHTDAPNWPTFLDFAANHLH